MNSSKWKVVSSNAIYKGRITLREDEVLLPNGRTIMHIALEYPESVAVVPILSNNDILLIRQYRYIVDSSLWEIPAGGVKAAESPEAAAHRELEEETGYRARKMENITSYYTNVGTSDHRVHVFLAQSLTSGRRNLDDSEQIEIEVFGLREAVQMVFDGRIVNGFATIGILLAAQIMKC